MNNLCERHGRLRCGECAYVAQLEEEREKMIEGLLYLMKELGKLSVKPENGTAIHAYKKMRNILREIGVTLE